MKKNQVHTGGTFVARVSGALVRVRLDAESPYGGWNGVNLETGRRVRIKSAQRLRRVASPRLERQAADQAEAQAASASSALPPYVDPIDVARAETAKVLHPPAYDPDRCATPRCKDAPVMTHLGKPLCSRCWEQVCERSNETAPVCEPVEQADGAATQDPADATTLCREPVERASANQEENLMATKKTTKSKKAPKTNAKASAKPKAPAKAKAPREKRRGEPAEPKEKRVSALDAAATVLRKAGKPMRSQELITAMADQGLWKSPGGKTPHATLYAAMLREINEKGKAARFKKVDRGQFQHSGVEDAA